MIYFLEVKKYNQSLKIYKWEKFIKSEYKGDLLDIAKMGNIMDYRIKEE